MSKCKAVLDGDKIATIQVVVKAPPQTSLGTPGTKSPGGPKPALSVPVQQSK